MKYLDFMKHWEKFSDSPPDENLRSTALGWEGIVNQAYSAGYKDGTEGTPYKRRIQVVKEGE